MIYFKIITQVITAIAGLAAIFLEYKWHDKRTNIFKTTRNWLIFLTIASLICGVIITTYDENNKDQEIAAWKNKFDKAERTLNYIKSNGDSLKSQMKPLFKTIKSFDVSVYIEFSGKWKSQPYDDWVQPSSPQIYLMWSDTNNRLPEIGFFSPKIFFKTISKNSAVFENTFSVPVGMAPLGESIEVLKGYNKLNFQFPFNAHNNLLDYDILITKANMIFYINGIKSGEFSESNIEVHLPRGAPSINPSLTLRGNLSEGFNMKL